ncbi:hypothetical protein [Sandarakinorhabdus oryzae]|uniref:hypothetical protein n=1 Tax=Sandarakinorhabdus oryzae TaxID=2675220 RepID=UPI0012E1339C|nr:hypothetical protein [Sandarakinorhabdus oryzae]
MPYRQAHWYVGLVLAVILAGFWASYWSPIRAVPLAFHVHALSSCTWLTLLIVQSVAIHRRSNALHKQLGLASLALFPVMILGFMMIIDVSARHFAAAKNPFSVYLGPSFGIGMLLAIGAYLTLFYLALKHRRTVRLHAGYMLATPLILFESPFSRVIGEFLPWLNIINSKGPQNVLDTIVVGDGIAILFALGLYAMNRKHGAPWLVASAFMATQAVAMWFAPFMPELATAFGAYAQIPFGLTASAGIAAGALAGWLGWRAGGGGRRPMPARA